MYPFISILYDNCVMMKYEMKHDPDLLCALEYCTKNKIKNKSNDYIVR